MMISLSLWRSTAAAFFPDSASFSGAIAFSVSFQAGAALLAGLDAAFPAGSAFSFGESAELVVAVAFGGVHLASIPIL
jgi:hypothetical protein